MSDVAYFLLPLCHSFALFLSFTFSLVLSFLFLLYIYFYSFYLYLLLFTPFVCSSDVWSVVFSIFYFLFPYFFFSLTFTFSLRFTSCLSLYCIFIQSLFSLSDPLFINFPILFRSSLFFFPFRSIIIVHNSVQLMFGYVTQYYNYHYYSNCNYYVNSQTYASNNYYVSMTQLATEVSNYRLPFSGHVCAN
jgi:hypothetical protein